jgi:hypothetical protein
VRKTWAKARFLSEKQGKASGSSWIGETEKFQEDRKIERTLY